MVRHETIIGRTDGPVNHSAWIEGSRTDSQAKRRRIITDAKAKPGWPNSQNSLGSRDLAGLRTFGHTVTFTELIHAAPCIDDLLFAGIKRVARRADFDVQILAQCGARSKFIATAAGDFYLGVIWMNFGFHIAFPFKGARENTGRGDERQDLAGRSPESNPYPQKLCISLWRTNFARA